MFSQNGTKCRYLGSYVEQISTDKLFARKNAIRSVSSSTNSLDFEVVEEGPWIHHRKAWLADFHLHFPFHLQM